MQVPGLSTSCRLHQDQ